MNPKIFGRVLVGLILLAVGGMFLLRQLGYVSFDFDIGYLITTFWPLILIAVGAQTMMHRGGGWWGIFLIGLGAFFQARNLGLVDLSLGDVFRYGWPVLLIWWGLSMIFRPGSKKKSDGGWQSYPPRPDGPYHGGDHPAPPPPPPLHPNPLDLDYEPPKADEPGAAGHSGSGAGAGGRHGTGAHHGASGHHGAHGWHGTGDWSGKEGAGGRANREPDDDQPDWMPNLNAENRSGFIGDIHLGGDYWELRPMNISLFIGDTVLDLTKAQIPFGETRLNISSFIGDVKVFVPNDRDLGIRVTTSSFIGDTKVIDRQEGGFFKNVKFETSYYQEAERRIRLNVSSFIGDVRIVKVG